MAATASIVRRWMLVEHRGPWPDRQWFRCLPRTVAESVRRFARVHSARPVLVRRTSERGQLPHVTGRMLLVVSEPHVRRLRELTVEPDDLVTVLDPGQPFEALGDRLHRPLYLVCVHSSHDVCCGIHGRKLVRDAGSLDLDLWECSHVGGDRFAANVIVLPDGTYYGQVTADDLRAIAEATTERRLLASRLRGRSFRSRPEQLAEHSVRQQLGLWADHDVRDVHSEPIADRSWRVAVEHVQGTTVVQVEESLASPRRLTCHGAPSESPMLRVRPPS